MPIMATKLNPRALARAQEVAEELKARLSVRVIGKKRPSMECNCGKVHSGVSKAVDIVYKKADEDDADQIGMWHHWMVRVEELKNPHRDSHIYLSDFIPAAELEPLFREKFDPLGVPVKRYEAKFYARGLDFKWGGFLSLASERHTVFVRPIKPNHFWHSADIRLLRNAPRCAPEALMLTCGIDPFSVHYASRYSEHYTPADGIFAIPDVDGNRLIPIARINNVDRTRGIAEVQIAAGNEFFDACS